MTHRSIRPLAALALCLLPLAVRGATDPGHGPANATVLIIRHAEKSDDGDGLTPAGETRAKAYVKYFQDFKFQSQPATPNVIFAAADSRNSRRPRITVEPLAHALGLNVNTSFDDKDYRALADELRAHQAGKNILLCWHHGRLREMLQALGANPDELLPGGEWPSGVYHWLIVLRYDANGNLTAAQRETEPF